MELTSRRPLRDNGAQRFVAERVDDDVSVEINLLPLYRAHSCGLFRANLPKSQSSA